MVVLHVFLDSERDKVGWVAQEWQVQRDVIIEQRPIGPSLTFPYK